MFNHLFQSSLVELHFRFDARQSGILQFFRHKVALGNLYLLLGDVAAHLDDFHTVEQRTRNGSDVVGCCNEEHFRQVVVHIQIIIVERVVLFGVQHLQQRRCRVAVDGVLRHLVNLVQDKHGVRRTRLLNTLDYSSGHGSDIGATVSANLSLIVQAAQRNAHILTLQRLGNALAQTRLAHTRRTIEAEYGRLHVAPKLQNGDIFQYALLHLLHAVVVAVQHLLCPFQVEVVLRELVPRKAHHRLQVVYQHTIVRTLRVQCVQLVHFLAEYLSHLFRPFLFLGFLFQLLAFRRSLAATQFLLDILHLLLQEVFALLFVQVFARLHADVLLQFQQLRLAVEDFQQSEQAVFQFVFPQQVHLVFHAERHVRADKVDGDDGIRDIAQGKLRLVGYLVVFADILNSQRLHVLVCRIKLLVAVGWKTLRQRCRHTHQERTLANDVV